MNTEKRKILFICFHHGWNDPRLYFRQAKTLLSSKNSSEVEIAFMISNFREPFGDKTSLPDDIGILNVFSTENEKPGAPGSLLKSLLPSGFIRTWQKFQRKIRLFFKKYRIARSYNADVVQASDIREITFALSLKLLTGCKIIYDSHEDYFNFFYEFGNKSRKSWIRGIYYSMTEWVWLRFFDAVFCTDEFLFEKYRQHLYGIRKLHLLRNFPFKDVEGISCSEHVKSGTLELVYIGSINKYRGVLEAAEFVEQFNEKHGGLNVCFSYYGLETPLVQELVEKKRIMYKGSLPYVELMRKLSGYDVGISTLLPIKKYTRNIPMKNFEYMMAGLPLITSNFGACKFYTEQAEAGICIEPTNYRQFEDAILSLFNEKLRNKLGRNGYNKVQNEWHFRREASEYMNEMLS